MRSTLNRLKEAMYFHGAAYFGFWAKFVLKRWKPKVIVVTGSSGKTTMLNMLEAQIDILTKVSHHANSAYGVPFNILGLKGVEGSRMHWVKLFLQAPLKAMTTNYDEKYYLAEADADRPKEGDFLAKLLTPEITIWVSSSRTHGMNFEKLVKSGQYKSVESAVAAEFANFVKHTSELVLIDGDNNTLVRAAHEAKSDASIYSIKYKQEIRGIHWSEKHTMVILKSDISYLMRQPMPPEVGYQVAYLDKVLQHLGIEPDYDFRRMKYPPGRSNFFKGKGGYKIIDSTYNSNLSSATAILNMMEEYPGKKKLLVIGDLLEQGEGEAEEHRKLGLLLSKLSFKPYQIVLLGPRVKKYTYPILKEKLPDVPTSVFTRPSDVLMYLSNELNGDEVVLFKGARFLEGVIAKLLEHPGDSRYLARQTKVWQKRREQWGL